MILENKKIVINNLKIKLEELIKKSLIELPIDFNNISTSSNGLMTLINKLRSTPSSFIKILTY